MHRFGGGYEPPVGGGPGGGMHHHPVLPSTPISRLRRSSLDYDLAGVKFNM